MRIVVQKYGGSSVATVEKLKNVARRVVATKRAGCATVVVVSAMGDDTDELVELARQFSANPAGRELDSLLVTGEMVSISLLAIAIQEMGERAVALNGLQCGIFTNDIHSNARILEVRAGRLRQHLEGGDIAVVAGFQGFSSAGDFTTLGRGGSDTTAVALAAALNADECQIYTDVAGVLTADPRLVPRARYLRALHTTEMQELAWTGAKVLKAEAVEFARNNGVPIIVRSTFDNSHETSIHPRSAPDQDFRPQCGEVTGVSGRKDVIRISLSSADIAHVKAEAICDFIAKYDLILGATGNGNEPMDILISNLEIPDPAAFAMQVRNRFGPGITVADQLGMVSLVGFGLGTRLTAFLEASRLLRGVGLDVLKSFTTREAISFVVSADRVNEGVLLLHEAFIERVHAEKVLATRANIAEEEMIM